MPHLKKLLAGAALAVASLFAIASPASAASSVPVVVSDPSTTGVVTETAKCVDQGGVAYTVSVDFNYYYEDANGSLRASVSNLVIQRTNKLYIDDGVDFRLRGYSYHISTGTLNKIQDLVFDGANLGSDNKLVLNPRNVLYRVGKSLVVVSGLGTDNDGLGAGTCARIEFFVPKLTFNADA